MKTISPPTLFRLAIAAGAMLVSGALNLKADLVIDSFPDATSASAWSATWGTSPTLAWDAQDSKGSASSGSLKVSAGYFTPADDGWEQMVITRTFDQPVLGSSYLSVSVDVKVDPASVPTTGGQYGYFELKRTSDGSSMGGVNLTSTNWTTISFNIAPTEGTLNGIIIQNGNGGFQGPITYYLDNFVFHAPPPPQTVIDTFDTAPTVDNWSPTWGTSPVLSWDAQDAGNSSSSGSMRVSADYFTAADDGWEQMVITKTFSQPIVGSDYVSVSVDVKVDPSSTPTTGGQYGYFELKRPDGSSMGGINLTSTNWTTITFPISATEGTLSGIIIQNGSGTFQGPIIYYLDNFVFNKPAVIQQPPALAIDPNRHPGLRLYASAPNENFQRQNIVYAPSENLSGQLWWVNQSAPMTYSVTWADFPDKNVYRGFQGHIMLISDSTMATGNPFPDYADANVIMVEFQYVNTAGPDGTNGTPDDQVLAQARLLHKVNEPNSNAMLYRGPNTNGLPVGILGQLRAPSMLGTWTISFLDNTNITMTAPDNSSINLVMPDADAPYYEPAVSGVSAQFGIMPNDGTPSHVGQYATISRIKIAKGATVLVDDNFQAQQLDPAAWIVRARDAAGIFTVTPDVAYLVNWFLPDTGFTLRAASSIKGPWSPYGTATLVGAQRFVLVNKASQPGATAGFFQLIK